MLSYLFGILLLISTNVFAGYVNVASCLSGEGGSIFSSKENCEATTGSECLTYPGGKCSTLDYVDNYVDGAAQYLKADTQVCSDAQDCQTKLEALTCTDPTYNPIKNLDQMEVYCVKFNGYDQVLAGKKLSLNLTKLAALQAAQTAENNLKAALDVAQKSQECGRKAMAYILVRNSVKNLTTAMVKSLIQNFSEVQSLLESGSLTTAIEEINAITADGTLITNEDKTAVVAMINSCKP